MDSGVETIFGERASYIELNVAESHEITILSAKRRFESDSLRKCCSLGTFWEEV
jgi:hypothetical protein